MSYKTRYMLIIIAVAVVVVFLYGKIDPRAESYRGTDLKYYRAMAAASPQIDKNIPRPFSRRILGPWLVGLLPMEDDTSFYTFNYTVSLGIIVLLYLFLCGAGLSPAASTLSTLFLALNKHLLGSSVWNCYQVKDSLSFLIILAALTAMKKGRFKILAVLLFLGALTSETTLIMVPVLLVYAAEKGIFRQNLGKLAAVVLSAAAAFTLTRILIPPAGGNSAIEAFLFYSKKIRYPMVWYGLFINPFIPLSFLPVIFSDVTLEFFSRNRYAVVYLALVFFAALFGSNNERLAAPSFPIYFLLIGQIIENKVLSRRSLSFVLSLFCVLSFFHHEIARFRLPSREATIVLSGGSLMAVTLIFFILRLRRSALKPSA